MSDPEPTSPREGDDRPGTFDLDEESLRAAPPPEAPGAPPLRTPAHAPPVASGVQCLQCGYDLTGVPIGSTCPECGAAVMPSFQSPSYPANGKAITSMVLGIVSIPTCMCYGVPGVICGALAIGFERAARKELATDRYSPGSASMAQAGMICGIIGLALGLFYVVFFLVAIGFNVWGGL